MNTSFPFFRSLVFVSVLLTSGFYGRSWARAPDSGGNLPVRDVSLEWETIPEAETYDVEVTRKPKGSSPPRVFNSKMPTWKGQLAPGYYLMRIRSKDRRRVPGDWSEAVDMTVMLEPPKSSQLKNDERIEAKEAETHDKEMQWNPVPGADSYEVKIEGFDGKEIHKVSVEENRALLTLPVARRLKWTVIARNREGLQSEAPLQGNFEIWGPELAQPEPEEPANAYVREINWTRDELSRDIQYSLQVLDPKTKKWRTVDTKKDIVANKLNFAAGWPGGHYRLNLRAQADLRKISKIASLQFDVIDGDRSEAAEYSAMLRQSIVRTTGWFAIASYLVTAMQYQGVNADNGGTAPLQVKLPNNFGGTGRVGAGWLSNRSPWGFLSIIDMSGFIVAGRNPTFTTLETNLIRRSVIGSSGEIRQQAGLFYKEVPEIIAKDLTGIDRIEKIAAAGPHYGLEYWWAMSPKFGLQANAHAYASLFSVKTPTGNPVSASLSYQMGLLGSYRFNDRASGLIGYAYRHDTQSYNSSNERKNTVNITGHYLNLFLEWAL